ncbi:Undecaprenyl-phosphate 4-deoxy-4-formamido-L-arabinose transferase [Planctomycetes bacterium Poly30]|uniref:Undecaprenyl-phosphate 4-deoxy-4-formamido-L-arabinose transferase n=1 Tax=Saltatorellus ferox TaxID=2528018 RepID=A0A518EX79_9BACT|nr:Undecaprenyl-phosphate 4-deoxy-4-formamido-L-arabinose transferase [Planctomycetes bacterium Poly30]
MNPEKTDLLPFQVREHWPADGSVSLSVVAPVYDEEENLPRLLAKMVEALGSEADWELVLVDDGSRDGSARIIRELHAKDARVKGVFFQRNCGQTAAIAAGIQVAAGELIATIDADLQNDPMDLPAMVTMLREGGHDAVVGWRKKRQDSFVRRASSRVANRVRNSISADSIRDTGCSLKVFRRAPIQALPLFEGMHRFLPTLLRYHGFDVAETPVGHHPRTAGVSKYGIGNRAWKATKDLVAVRWMRKRRLLLPIGEVLRD